MSDCKVLGGKVTYKHCTCTLLRKNEKAYELLKILSWLDLVNRHRSIAIRWYKPTKSGLSAKFKTIESDEDINSEIEKINQYIKDTNSRLGAEISLIERAT